MGKGEGGGEGKIRLPAGLVRLQNPYTRWTAPLIGAAGCNLIDACHLRYFLFFRPFLETYDLERKWRIR